MDAEAAFFALRGQAPSLLKLFETQEDLLKQRDEMGDSLLHLAAQSGSLPTVQVLLRHGADPNALNTSGSTPLHKAVLSGPNDIIRELLRSGADPLIVNHNGYQAGSFAKQPQTLSILYGSDIIQESMEVEKDKIQKVIGKRGIVVKQLQQNHGVCVTKKPDVGAYATIMVCGSPQGVETALTEIKKIINLSSWFSGPGVDPHLQKALAKPGVVVRSLDIPKIDHYCLIGKEGRTLKDFQKNPGVHLHIPPKESPSTNIILVAPSNEVVEKVVQKIDALLFEKRKRDAQLQHKRDSLKESLYVPRQLHHFLIGKGGVSFKKITKETGVAMIVPSAESYNELVSLKGTQQEIDAAVGLICSILKEEGPKDFDVETEIKIVPPSFYGETVKTKILLAKHHHQRLLIHHNLAHLEEEEGVELKLGVDFNSPVIITGPIENVNRVVKRFSPEEKSFSNQRGGNQKEKGREREDRIGEGKGKAKGNKKMEKRKIEEEKLTRLREKRKLELDQKYL